MFQIIKDDIQMPQLSIPTSVCMLFSYLTVVAILPYAPSYCWFLVPFLISFGYFFWNTKSIVAAKQLPSDAYPDKPTVAEYDDAEPVDAEPVDAELTPEVLDAEPTPEVSDAEPTPEASSDASDSEEGSPWIQYPTDFIASLQQSNWVKPEALTETNFDGMVQEASTPSMSWQHASIGRRNAWFNNRLRSHGRVRAY